MSYPEHEKLKKVAEQSQVIGEFVDIFLGGKGIMLAHYYEFVDTGGKQLTTHGVPAIDDLLAEFFDIDRDKLETEKRAMLEQARSEHRKEDHATR